MVIVRERLGLAVFMVSVSFVCSSVRLVVIQQRELRIARPVLEDRAALRLEVRAVRRTAGDGLQELLRLQPERLRLLDPERGTGGDRGHPRVRDELHGARRPRRLAEPDGLRPDRVEHRGDDVARQHGSGREDRELPVLGGLLRADHGGVVERDAARLRELRQPGDPVPADRARLHPHRAGVERRDRLRDHLRHRGLVEQHRDHDLRAAHRLLDRARDGRESVLTLTEQVIAAMLIAAIWSLNLKTGTKKLLVSIEDRTRLMGFTMVTYQRRFYFTLDERFSNVRWAELIKRKALPEDGNVRAGETIIRQAKQQGQRRPGLPGLARADRGSCRTRRAPC